MNYTPDKTKLETDIEKNLEKLQDKEVFSEEELNFLHPLVSILWTRWLVLRDIDKITKIPLERYIFYLDRVTVVVQMIQEVIVIRPNKNTQQRIDITTSITGLLRDLFRSKYRSELSKANE